MDKGKSKHLKVNQSFWNLLILGSNAAYDQKDFKSLKNVLELLVRSLKLLRKLVPC